MDEVAMKLKKGNCQVAIRLAIILFYIYNETAYFGMSPRNI